MPDIETGTQAIRAALFARAKQTNLPALARDLGISGQAIDAFVYGEARLAPEHLEALTRYLFQHHFTYDAKNDIIAVADPRPATTFGYPPQPPREPAPKKVYPVGTMAGPGPQVVSEVAAVQVEKGKFEHKLVSAKPKGPTNVMPKRPGFA